MSTELLDKRAHAHKLLDAFLDRLDETPQLDESREDSFRAILHAYRALVGFIAGDFFTAHAGAARLELSTEPLGEADPWAFDMEEAIAAGKTPFTASELRDDPEAARAARYVLAHFLLWHEPLLPPGLAAFTKVALESVNLGAEEWLGTPYKRQGAGPTAKNTVIQEALIYRIYYAAGYHGVSLDAAKGALEKSAIVAGEAPPSQRALEIRTMEKWVGRKPELRRAGAAARDRGKADAAGGVEPSPRHAPGFSFGQLWGFWAGMNGTRQKS